jgi:hypothetical protein
MTYEYEVSITMEAGRLTAAGVNTQHALTQQLNKPLDVIVDAFAQAMYANEIEESEIPDCIYKKVHEEISGR